MKRARVLTLVACIAAAQIPVPARGETTLRAVSFQPENVSLARHFYRWARDVTARCPLAIDISGPEAIPAALQWHALKTGEVDVYFGPASYYRGALPHADVLSLAHNEPAAQRDNGAWALINQLHNQTLNAWYLTNLAAGVKFFVYTSRPAESGRLNGLRIRSVPLYETFLRTLGAQTRFLAAANVRDALEQGTIDGYIWPLWSAGLGWEKFVKVRHGPGFLNAASPVLINLDRWHALTGPQRACLTEMAMWVENRWPSWRAEENARQLAMLRAAGTEYVELGPEFATKAEAILWTMLESAEPAFVRAIRPLLDASP